MDVVKSRLQADGVYINKYKGVLDCISQSYQKEGLKVSPTAVMQGQCQSLEGRVRDFGRCETTEKRIRKPRCWLLNYEALVSSSPCPGLEEEVGVHPADGFREDR